MKPDLSIIIVSFNTEALTLSAIESVYKDGSRLEKQIIVVDNDSKDGSLKSLRGLEQSHKDFVLIENKKNLGFAKANNQGIKKAKGKYILLLNSDTIVRPGALGKMVEFVRNAPDAAVIGARLLNSDGSVQPSCFHFPTVWRAIAEYWLGKKGFFTHFAPLGESPKEVEALVGASFLLTPIALEKVGLLDERYFFYFEDIDYCRRVRKAGLKVYYLPEAKIVHFGGASGRSLAAQKDQWRRLIPSSKIYHGTLGHYLLFSVMWLGQKWEQFLKKPN